MRKGYSTALECFRQWMRFLGVTVRDVAFIWRCTTGEDWTDEEINLLGQIYSEDRDTVLRALPSRTWGAVRCEAARLGLTRHKQYKYSTIPEDMCYDDLKIMREYDLEYSEETKEKRVWWKNETIQNFEGSSMTSSTSTFRLSKPVHRSFQAAHLSTQPATLAYPFS